ERTTRARRLRHQRLPNERDFMSTRPSLLSYSLSPTKWASYDAASYWGPCPSPRNKLRSRLAAAQEARRVRGGRAIDADASANRADQPSARVVSSASARCRSRE